MDGHEISPAVTGGVSPISRMDFAPKLTNNLGEEVVPPFATASSD